MFAFCSPRLFSLFSAAFVKLSQFPQISPALHQIMTRSWRAKAAILEFRPVFRLRLVPASRSLRERLYWQNAEIDLSIFPLFLSERWLFQPWPLLHTPNLRGHLTTRHKILQHNVRFAFWSLLLNWKFAKSSFARSIAFPRMSFPAPRGLKLRKCLPARKSISSFAMSICPMVLTAI